MKELSSPIRMYWDVGPSAKLAGPEYRRIAEEIASNKLLTLQITETSSSISPSSLAIIETVKSKNIALSLVVPLTAIDTELLGSLPVRLTLVSIESLAEIGSFLEFHRKGKGKPGLGLSFSVTRENFKDLPDVLKICRDNNITTLVLPMQRLINGQEPFSCSLQERQELTAALEKIDRPASVKIVIHDPFLWRAFFPSVEFPAGGCQAANTMLYISPDADLYPCPTMPIKLGSLTHSSLKDLINSGQKRELRKKILTNPEGCVTCAELKQCKGGCRGRVYAMTESLTGQDPACK